MDIIEPKASSEHIQQRFLPEPIKRAFDGAAIGLYGEQFGLTKVTNTVDVVRNLNQIPQGHKLRTNLQLTTAQALVTEGLPSPLKYDPSSREVSFVDDKLHDSETNSSGYQDQINPYLLATRSSDDVIKIYLALHSVPGLSADLPKIGEKVNIKEIRDVLRQEYPQIIRERDELLLKLYKIQNQNKIDGNLQAEIKRHQERVTVLTGVIESLQPRTLSIVNQASEHAEPQSNTPAEGDYLSFPPERKIFHIPPAEDMEDILAADPRLRYIPISPYFLEAITARAKTVAEFNNDPDTEPPSTPEALADRSQYVFRDQFVLDMARKIQAEFPDTILRVRGGATFLNETQDVILPSGEVLYNPVRAVTEGKETSIVRGDTHLLDLAHRFDINHDGNVHIQTRSWLVRHPQGFRSELVAAGRGTDAEKIFPMLMFYKDKGENEKPELVRAIILDYPMLPLTSVDS